MVIEKKKKNLLFTSSLTKKKKYINIYIYIYIHKERERGGEGKRGGESECVILTLLTMLTGQCQKAKRQCVKHPHAAKFEVLFSSFL